LTRAFAKNGKGVIKERAIMPRQYLSPVMTKNEEARGWRGGGGGEEKGKRGEGSIENKMASISS